MVKRSAPHTFRRRHFIMLGIVAIALYVIVPQLGSFQSSWELLRKALPGEVGMATAFTGTTYLFAALTYCLLAFKKLHYGQAVLVQLAAMFVNRLLPAGVGALGINYGYMRGSGHTVAQSTTVIAMNNILGFIGHALLVGTILATTSLALGGSQQKLLLSSVAVAGVTLGVILLARFGSRRVKHFLQSLRMNILSYRRRPGRLLAATGSSIGLTLSNIISLYYCMLALDIHLSALTIAIVFTFGIGAGTLAPTPGGLGGFEAGLVAGLMAYDVAAAPALAIALLYRFISYWLALLMGALAFFTVQRRGLLKL